jgi:hypothetical protein
MESTKSFEIIHVLAAVEPTVAISIKNGEYLFHTLPPCLLLLPRPLLAPPVRSQTPPHRLGRVAAAAEFRASASTKKQSWLLASKLPGIDDDPGVAIVRESHTIYEESCLIFDFTRTQHRCVMCARAIDACGELSSNV